MSGMRRRYRRGRSLSVSSQFQKLLSRKHIYINYLTNSGEQKCQRCRYITCCWRAFKEHQLQVHNERPKTSLIVPSPLINIPLEKKMQCPCGYTSINGNRLGIIMKNNVVKFQYYVCIRYLDINLY